MKKIIVVCNSTNSDLVNYFKCKLSVKLKFDTLIAFKNHQIIIENYNVHAYTSSFMNKAFLDKFVLIDFFLSFYLAFVSLKSRAKAIHFTTAHISNLFLSILLKPFSIKQIFTIHDLSPHPDNKSKFIQMYNNVVINLLADEVVSFSQSEIDKQPKKEKFRHFPLSGFKLIQKKPKKGNKTLLFFGRMEPYKGFDHLLDLVKLADMANLDYSFVIAGKGNIPNKSELEKFGNVKIMNRFIDDAELENLFTQASFSILPYDSATQSGVILLSYAYATPVIAYDVGALKEYIEDKQNGFVIPKTNNKMIIELLKEIDERTIMKMSERTIEIFQRTYSVDRCRKLYFDYYSSLLANESIPK